MAVASSRTPEGVPGLVQVGATAFARWEAKDLLRHMASTFETVAKVISDTTEIPLDQITPDVHTIDDLGIDSLDFLDIVFALDKKFGIKIPLEAWTEEVNEGRASVDDYFVLKNLCARIDELVAAKSA